MNLHLRRRQQHLVNNNNNEELVVTRKRISSRMMYTYCKYLAIAILFSGFLYSFLAIGIYLGEAISDKVLSSGFKLIKSDPSDETTGGPTYAIIHQPQLTYRHDMSNITSVQECTSDQIKYISLDLIAADIRAMTRCPSPTWIESFFQEEPNIGTDSFLGISIGCNKGFDAIQTARMGMSNTDFNRTSWKNEIVALGMNAKGACDQEAGKDFEVTFSNRPGEMHCVEPMPDTSQTIISAARKLKLESKNFYVNQAAISSANGYIDFPNVTAGRENVGINQCGSNGCVKVPMYSLDSYVEQFVKSKGPINVLQIDVEGWDFDVLFGASNTLDRTYYLEFEYHSVGNWGRLHLPDAVRLLNVKGYTCYWQGSGKLWRITDCYHPIYNTWHGWSNVACVHRSHHKLAKRMEHMFQSAYENKYVNNSDI